ncbi:MAG: CPBP family intramembrane metalloprotease [Planctomycetes bacterium]|nr:CPBP family intramembrane metalloprotease [Planctomycetota bacterium]
MSGAPRARLAEPLLQLPAAIVGAALCAANLKLGLAVLAVLAVVWPPRVAMRPLAAGSVMRFYPPFLVAWALFAVGYLRLVAAVGEPVTPQPQLVELAEHGWATEGLPLIALGVAVLAPLFEELLFRGYLFTALAVMLPMWLVQLVTATLFGLAHGLEHALPIGVLSLLFGYLRQRHGSLWPGVLAHALHNALTLVLVMTWPDLLDLLYGR